ncbi:hypothetical protein AB0B56_29815 [Streptosporangium canum]|uniref:hypothetical protein n=1 Tax=Streptosporangium canum TaxID=324952 RepID=UPI00342AB6E6
MRIDLSGAFIPIIFDIGKVDIEDLVLDRAEFLDGFYLSSLTIHGQTSFINATFHGEVEIYNIKIQSDMVSFDGAKFKSHLNLDNSTLMHGSRFDGAEFTGDYAQFAKTHLGDVYFNGAKFDTRTTFPESRFYSIRFERAVGAVDLSRALSKKSRYSSLPKGWVLDEGSRDSEGYYTFRAVP